jgi:predicted glycosyltransferase
LEEVLSAIPEHPLRVVAAVRGAALGAGCQLITACDLAVVQGGLTTCMELTATGRPFIYVPLRHHFEQNHHVAHRLDRYGAGHRLAYDEADPDHLADLIAARIGAEVGYRPVETDGADRAAAMLADLL